MPELKPYAKRVAVFGSFVRDDLTPDSDIDLLVTLKPPEERPRLGLRWFSLEERLSQMVGRKVDLVSESALSPFIRSHVYSEMVILYEER
ncbi:MAG: nucleotidyltransferase family protein [Clostridia bacterium]|nr:nucleotidyltransferase family protein [Clostridia bacterium]MDH7572563.1 nucleotidyltransferase family protein [Clostridia bacterium]